MNLEEAKKYIGKNMIHPIYRKIEIKNIRQLQDGTILAYHNETVCNIEILKEFNG